MQRKQSSTIVGIIFMIRQRTLLPRLLEQRMLLTSAPVAKSAVNEFKLKKNGMTRIGFT